MAEFCEKCPNRGDCSGEIDEIGSSEVFAVPFWGKPYSVGHFAVAFANKKPSHPMAVDPSDVRLGRLEERISNCSGPSNSPFFARKPNICGASEAGGTDYLSTAASVVLSETQLADKIVQQMDSVKSAK